ncbi:MAG: WXG100 family type VII secretion target [Clostridia bacterium]|nr:WXG100 family type VII secretion target [Clostridia bacterium]
MAHLFLDYEGACSKVQKARDYKTQHDTVISELKALINGMTDVWTGNAQTKLAQEFSDFETTFKNFSQMLDDYANEMQAWADKLKAADDNR